VFSSSSNDSPHDPTTACRRPAGCFGLLVCSITTHGKDAAVSLCVHPVLRPQYHNAIGKARPQQNDDTRIFYHYNAGVSRNFNIFSKTSTNSSPFAAFRFLFIPALPKKWVKYRSGPHKKRSS
jgi:hypothetical protein